MKPIELIERASNALEKAYAPYSNFHVGAALITKDGKIFEGCNIENASYTPTNCAERTAFFKAVSEGEHNFSAIAVAAKKDEKLIDSIAPCGVCRQVMREFCGDDFKIYLRKGENGYEEYTLAELLPKSFSPKDLRGDAK